MMGYWFSYKMELVAYGPGNTITARDCVGEKPGGACNFKEFMKHIHLGANPLNLDWDKVSDIATSRIDGN